MFNQCVLQVRRPADPGSAQFGLAPVSLSVLAQQKGMAMPLHVLFLPTVLVLSCPQGLQARA